MAELPYDWKLPARADTKILHTISPSPTHVFGKGWSECRFRAFSGPLWLPPPSTCQLMCSPMLPTQFRGKCCRLWGWGWMSAVSDKWMGHMPECMYFDLFNYCRSRARICRERKNGFPVSWVSSNACLRRSSILAVYFLLMIRSSFGIFSNPSVRIPTGT